MHACVVHCSLGPEKMSNGHHKKKALHYPSKIFVSEKNGNGFNQSKSNNYYFYILVINQFLNLDNYALK